MVIIIIYKNRKSGGFMKYSKQRELILNCIKENPRHLTADSIYEIVKKDNPNLSLGTVYRNLAQLVEHDMILKISISGEPDRYDGNVDDHLHFLCIDCGKVQDLFLDELTAIRSLVEQKGDVKIESFDILLKGTCSECKK